MTTYANGVCELQQLTVAASLIGINNAMQVMPRHTDLLTRGRLLPKCWRCSKAHVACKSKQFYLTLEAYLQWHNLPHLAWHDQHASSMDDKTGHGSVIGQSKAVGEK